MSLTIIDPYESAYQAQRIIDPSFSYEMRKVRRAHVEAVDKLLKDVGPRESVETESDWAALEKVVNFYCNRWPEDFNEFAKTIPDIRGSRKAGGYSEMKEIKYVGAIPSKLERLIKICFPMQQFNKNFTYKLVARIKLLKVGGVGN